MPCYSHLMVDVQRAYFCAEEKRDTFVELPDYVPAEFWAMHVGKLRKALYGTRPAAASWEDAATSPLALCRVAASPSRGRCMAMISLSLIRVRI